MKSVHSYGLAQYEGNWLVVRVGFHYEELPDFSTSLSIMATCDGHGKAEEVRYALETTAPVKELDFTDEESVEPAGQDVNAELLAALKGLLKESTNRDGGCSYYSRIQDVITRAEGQGLADLEPGNWEQAGEAGKPPPQVEDI